MSTQTPAPAPQQPGPAAPVNEPAPPRPDLPVTEPAPPPADPADEPGGGLVDPRRLMPGPADGPARGDPP